MRRVREERGASAVEFAIIASLLFLILFGTISFGIVYNRVQGLNASAREAARLGGLASTERTEIVERLKDSISVLNFSSIDTDCNSNPPTLSVGQSCVDVFRRPSPGAARVEVPGNTSQPCGVSSAGNPGEKSVVVEVFYRTQIDIPLWSSPQITLSAEGEFKCEGS